ncbi:MAG TPA: Zn-ribbon domain-containing OB-fold protein [Tepidiformaceae bacterium]
MERPQPRFPEPDTQPFYDATKAHRLTYQTCKSCGAVVFFPRAHCPACGSRELAWQDSKGLGTIYTFSVVRLNRHPAFAPLGPYAIAYVDLDEGFRILTNIVGVNDPTMDIAVGQRVQVEWQDQESGIALPLFRPV